MSQQIRFTIEGEPASKANSRELATIGPKHQRRTILRKSDTALSYERTALLQVAAHAQQILDGPVRVSLRIFYSTERPDLDESLLLDVLQAKVEILKDAAGKETGRKIVRKGIYWNDRQVREKHVYHGIDKRRPRAEVLVEPMQAQQIDLLDAPPVEDHAMRQLAMQLAAYMDELGDDVVSWEVERIRRQRYAYGLTHGPDERPVHTTEKKE